MWKGKVVHFLDLGSRVRDNMSAFSEQASSLAFVLLVVPEFWIAHFPYLVHSFSAVAVLNATGLWKYY